MRFPFRTLAMALLVALPALAAAPEGLRANYQLALREGNVSQTVRAAANVVPGEPIAYNFGKYRLALTIEWGEADDYVLNVAVSPAGKPGEVLATKSFKGTLVGAEQGPLEFRLEEKGILVVGALALSAPPPKGIRI